MKCPFCGHDNISGEDECAVCFENLSSLDGVVPKTKIEKILMKDPLSRLLSDRKMVLVTPETTVKEAIQKMNEAHVGCVLVKKNGDLVGIFTERDVLFKVAGGKKDFSTPVGQVMTPRPQILSEDDSLAYAVNRMSVYGFRHIPIVRNGKPVAVISVRDVLGYLSKLFP